MTPPPTKQCPACGEVLPRTAFSLSRRSHPDGPVVAQCRPCRNKTQRAWREANPEAAAEYMRRDRIRVLAKEYGLTLRSYRALEVRQQHRCAVCRRRLADVAVAVDHDHVTGAVRGLLCRPCNMGLGMLGDSWKTLARGMRYLKAEPPVLEVGGLELPLPPKGGSGSWHRRKTHCPLGHPYDEDNTAWRNGYRKCRTCEREQQLRRWREKNPDAPVRGPRGRRRSKT